MILNYSFENFFSFSNETTIDLTSTPKATATLFDLPLSDNLKLNKVSAFFGANGAGKSNLLKPLAFLSWFFNSSFTELNSDAEIPIKPHFSRENDNIKISVDFLSSPKNLAKSLHFKYSVELNQTRVIHESLKLKTSKYFSGVFDRKYDEAEDKYIYHTSKKYFKLPHDVLASTPSNTSLVSFIYRLFDKSSNADKELEKNDDLFSRLIAIMAMTFAIFSSNLCVNGRIERDVDEMLMDNSELYSKDKVVFERTSQLISEFDIGISKLDIVDEDVITPKGERRKVKMPYASHMHNGQEYALPLIYESSGTKSAYNILHSIVSRLVYGGVAIIDELDNDLHPLLLIEAIDLFKNPETNPHNAQLIFSTHTPEVLKHLKKHHCFIVEKSNSESEVWRLDSIEGIRSQDNLYTKYMSGALGGIPMVGR
ncbi:AAA family ATPase [Aeromonas caviae]|uniref:AAA family ATPase n=1 Tax=Aeromonas caviae TaxID=648 RepID=UPI0009B8153F|nr:ATP-binding protein [Aeromonas caviae]MBS4636461.1 ATP-binding protein [Aeromonas caviae]WQD89240.1 ATP-binding protein [Aeromonas caviae]SQH57712.1 Predicted ATPase [Aeromonas caviae]